jgi:hypothetical protein
MTCPFCDSRWLCSGFVGRRPKARRESCPGRDIQIGRAPARAGTSLARTSAARGSCAHGPQAAVHSDLACSRRAAGWRRRGGRGGQPCTGRCAQAGPIARRPDTARPRGERERAASAHKERVTEQQHSRQLPNVRSEMEVLVASAADPRCGVSTGPPLLLAPPTYLVGARGFGSRPRPATRRATTPATTCSAEAAPTRTAAWRWTPLQ